MSGFLSVFSGVFTVGFFCAAVVKGMPLLFGSVGEILTEKSGNLNLGIPGIMYMGGIGGLTAAYLYEMNAEQFLPVPAVLLSIAGCLLFSLVGGLIYSFLVVSLRVNQNVTGLALTTFGVGFANFLGGSLATFAHTTGSVSVRATGTAFKTPVPLLSDSLGVAGQMLFSYGFLTYVGILIAVAAGWFLSRTRKGLALRAVGENPGAADAAGIHVVRYKYLSTLAGSLVAGLGGLYFVMSYIGGVWQNNALGDYGWLSIALVIFASWRPWRTIWGSILFGALSVMFNYINVSVAKQELIKALPYAVTLIVLILTSLRHRHEDQPPASLGLSYFREER